MKIWFDLSSSPPINGFGVMIRGSVSASSGCALGAEAGGAPRSANA